MNMKHVFPMLILFGIGIFIFIWTEAPPKAPSPFTTKTATTKKTILPPPEKEPIETENKETEKTEEKNQEFPPEEKTKESEKTEETKESEKTEETKESEETEETKESEETEETKESEETEEEDYLPQQPAMCIAGEWIELGKSWMNPKTKEVELKNKVRVHPQNQILEVDGEVIVNEGLIELFACTERGKTHESVLILFCAPSHFQTGLMMLGLQPPTRGEFPGDPLAKEGSLLEITLSWKVKERESENEKVVTYPIYELIWNTQTKSPMSKQYWLFNGSFFSHDPIAKREVFVADISGNMITTLHDPDTIIDSTHELREDDTVFFANSNLLPPSGTPVTMTVKPAPKEQPK